jgi:hypothetical protein
MVCCQFDDDDVSVATRKFGHGRIVYLGAPKRVSPAAKSQLVAPIESLVEQISINENDHFTAGRFSDAVKGDNAALKASRLASFPDQLAQQSKLWSNKAEAFLRLGNYPEAEAPAKLEALEADQTNDKAGFRLAKSL